MAKKNFKRPSRQSGNRVWLVAVAILIAAAVVATVVVKRPPPHPKIQHAANAPKSNTVLSSTMELNSALMVTVDLDFRGGPLPTIAEALRQIGRRYQSADGTGRTFAVLDAYGQPTEENKLRVSMHVSSEKVGAGSLVFRRTGETLWQGRFTPMPPGKPPPNLGGKNLMIFVVNTDGKWLTVDGSSNPLSILDAIIKETSQSVREVWPDGQDREIIFIYSSCGCPVKVMTRREGDRTRRANELPVIFPDDPSVVDVITALMRW